LKGYPSSPQHKKNHKMDIITFTYMTNFKHSEMTVASQNDCKLTAYKFGKFKLLFSAEYLMNKILKPDEYALLY
jgi:hypothetical protein